VAESGRISKVHTKSRRKEGAGFDRGREILLGWPYSKKGTQQKSFKEVRSLEVVGGSIGKKKRSPHYSAKKMCQAEH